MKCDDCQIVIEEYFDGELNEQAALRVTRHLDGCKSCSGVLENLTTEQAVYVAGRSQIQVPPDLWPEVQARLALERQAEPSSALQRLQQWLNRAFVLPRFSGLTAVALVILAVALTTLLMRYRDWSPGNQTFSSVSENAPKAAPATQEEQTILERGPAAAQPHSSLEARQNSGANANVESVAAGRKSRPRRIETIGKTKSPEQLVREAEQKYLTAITLLSRTVERRRARLNPETLAKLQQALASIDRTIADTRKAVRQHPDDPVAVQYMLTAYAKKVDVLREMVD
jgi:hypothetical protein